MLYNIIGIESPTVIICSLIVFCIILKIILWIDNKLYLLTVFIEKVLVQKITAQILNTKEIKKYYLKSNRRIHSIHVSGIHRIKSPRFKLKFERAVLLDECCKTIVKYMKRYKGYISEYFVELYWAVPSHQNPWFVPDVRSPGDKIFKELSCKPRKVTNNCNNRLKTLNRESSNNGMKFSSEGRQSYRLYPLAKKAIARKSTNTIDCNKNKLIENINFGSDNVNNVRSFHSKDDIMKNSCVKVEDIVNQIPNDENCVIRPSARSIYTDIDRQSYIEINEYRKEINLKYGDANYEETLYFNSLVFEQKNKRNNKSKIMTIVKIYTVEKLFKLDSNLKKEGTKNNRPSCCKIFNIISTAKKYSSVFTEDEKASFCSKTISPSTAIKKRLCNRCGECIEKRKCFTINAPPKLEYNKINVEKLQKLIHFKLLSSIDVLYSLLYEKNFTWSVLRNERLHLFFDRNMSELVTTAKGYRKSLKSQTRPSYNVRRDICDMVLYINVCRNNYYAKTLRDKRYLLSPKLSHYKLENVRDVKTEIKTKVKNTARNKNIENHFNKIVLTKPFLTKQNKQVIYNEKEISNNCERHLTKPAIRGNMPTTNNHTSNITRVASNRRGFDTSQSNLDIKRSNNDDNWDDKTKSGTSLDSLNSHAAKIMDLNKRILKSKAIKHPIKSTITNFVIYGNADPFASKHQSVDRSQVIIGVQDYIPKRVNATDSKSPSRLKTKSKIPLLSVFKKHGQSEVTSKESDKKNLKCVVTREAKSPDGKENYQEDSIKYPRSKIPQLTKNSRKPDRLKYRSKNEKSDTQLCNESSVTSDKDKSGTSPSVSKYSESNTDISSVCTPNDDRNNSIVNTELKMSPEREFKDTNTSLEKTDTEQTNERSSVEVIINMNNINYIEDDVTSVKKDCSNLNAGVKGNINRNRSIITDKNVGNKTQRNYNRFNYRLTYLSRVNKRKFYLRGISLNVNCSNKLFYNKSRFGANISGSRFEVSYSRHRKYKYYKPYTIKKLYGFQKLLDYLLSDEILLSCRFSNDNDIDINNQGVDVNHGSFLESYYQELSAKKKEYFNELYDQRINAIREVRSAAELLIQKISTESLIKKIEERCRVFQNMSDDEIYYEKIVLRKYSFKVNAVYIPDNYLKEYKNECWPGVKLSNQNIWTNSATHSKASESYSVFKEDESCTSLNNNIDGSPEWLLNEVCSVSSFDFSPATKRNMDGALKSRGTKVRLSKFLKKFSCEITNLPKSKNKKPAFRVVLSVLVE